MCNLHRSNVYLGITRRFSKTKPDISRIDERIKSEELKKEVPAIETESNFIDLCVPARAVESETVFIYMNGCGMTRLGEFARNMVGHSQIAIPFYGRVAFLKR